MKSTNRTKKFSERTQLNFKATFTGGVFATPIIFNPNADDLRRIKNIPEEYDVKEPDYSRVIQDKEYRTVSLLLKFDPNEAMKLKTPKYGGDTFVKYDIYVSDRPVIGGKSGKTQVIDCHNQNGWLKLSGKKSIKDQLTAAQADDSPYHPGDPMRKMDPETVRIARQGEVALYDLVFKMSTLDKHRINNDEPEKSTRLDDFRLGENPTKVIENIFNGDYTALNMLMADNPQDFEGKEFFVKDGKNNELGIFLGVRPNQDGDKIYQDVLAPFTVFPVGIEATFRPTDRNYDYTDTKFNGVKLTKTKLNKKAVEYLTHEEYPWKSFWNNSFDFQEVTVDDLPQNQTETESVVIDDDVPF